MKPKRVVVLTSVFSFQYRWLLIFARKFTGFHFAAGYMMKFFVLLGILTVLFLDIGQVTLIVVVMPFS